MVKVYEKIEDLRKKRGVTKAFLARQLGISSMGYHYISVGRTDINTERLQLLSEVFGVSPSYFFTEDQSELQMVK